MLTDIEGYISLAKMEIEQLQEDIYYATNNVTIRVIQNAIENRKESIKKVKEKFGS